MVGKNGKLNEMIEVSALCSIKKLTLYELIQGVRLVQAVGLWTCNQHRFNVPLLQQLVWRRFNAHRFGDQPL